MKEQQFEHILHQALCPEIDPEAAVVHVRYSGKGKHMNIKQVIRKACTAAAIILVLATTAYAADALNIKTLLTGSGSRTYESVEQAEEKAGFEIDAKKTFANGYAFAGARVNETKALDEEDRVRLTYNEIHVDLRSASGQTLSLTAHKTQDRIPDSGLAPEQARKIGEITVNYRVDHYKFVPADYELTEADKAMMERPGNYISYGSETVGETDAAFVTWEKDGISYLIMDMDAHETADSLFSMAEELILSGE